MRDISPELRDHSFTHDIAKYWLEECLVCQHPIKHGEQVVKLSCCSATYHFKCLDQWFSNKRARDRSCPWCRALWSRSRLQKLSPRRETINPYERLYGLLLVAESCQEVLQSRLQSAYNQDLFDQISVDCLSQELSELGDIINDPQIQRVEVVLAVAREPRVEDHGRKILEYGSLRVLPERIPKFTEKKEVVEMEYEEEVEEEEDEHSGEIPLMIGSDIGHPNLDNPYHEDQEQFGEIPLMLGPDIGYPSDLQSMRH